MNNSLTIQGVKKVYLHSDTPALDGVDLTIPGGCAFGLIGPNGAGKSTLIRLILGLLKPDAGQITVAGFDLATALPAARKLCGLAPQDPGFFPLLTVAENLRTFGAAAGLRGRALNQAVDSAVASTELGEHANKRADQLSGGMRQRVMIAMALSCDPKLLIADEPTTALDVTIQAQVLELIKNLAADHGTAVILITHDLGVVAETCDRAAVMYCGRIIEQGPVDALFEQPRHPYTAGLLASVPRIRPDRLPRLPTIPGIVPDLLDLPDGCRFRDRCGQALERCGQFDP